MAELSQQDVQFLKFLKDKGVKKDQAIGMMNAAKAKAQQAQAAQSSTEFGPFLPKKEAEQRGLSAEAVAPEQRTDFNPQPVPEPVAKPAMPKPSAPDQPEEFGPFLPPEIAKERGLGQEAVAPTFREPVKAQERVSPFGTNIAKTMEEDKGAPKPPQKKLETAKGKLLAKLGPVGLALKALETKPVQKVKDLDIPTILARTAAQPFEFLRDVSATIGQKLQPFVPESMKIDPNSTIGQVLSVMTPAGSEAIRLPTQKAPLLKPVDTIDTVREFAGEGITALANAGILVMPAAKVAGFAPTASTASRVGTNATLGFMFGTGGALEDEENFKTAKDVLTQGVISGAVAAVVPELPRIMKKVGQKTVDGFFNVLNRFTNKKTGEALQVVRKTPIEIIRKYGNSANPYKTRNKEFDVLYKKALDKVDDVIGADDVANVADDLIKADPEGKIGRIAKEISEHKGEWTLRQLHDLSIKLKGGIPTNAGNWTHDHSIANQTVKALRSLISKKSKDYSAVNTLYGKVSQYIKADQIIDKSGSGIVGISLSALLGNQAAGPVGAVGALVLKSAKAQRFFFEGITKMANAKTPQAASKVFNELMKQAPSKEAANALLRFAVLIGIREANN